MAGRAAVARRAGGRWGRSGCALLLGLLALPAPGCGHDWSAADATGDGLDAEAGDVVDGDDGVGGRCGDGVRDPGEECDDGRINSDTLADACRTDCVRAHCGDGVVDSRETCDDGNDVDDDACRNDCALSSCGDGTVDPGEACDDGNDANTDACLNTCAAASCGDGFVRSGAELCDSPDPIPCTTGCGSSGRQACLECQPVGECTPPPEACNAVDDDCDGTADDGFACAAGQPAACTTQCGSAGTGPCTSECQPADVDSCTPPGESCNALDDDCDTAVDEDFRCVFGEAVPCTTPCGTEGLGACTDACLAPDGDACPPPPELCDGVDQDCDTSIDEDLECVAGSDGACTVGTCSGTRVCSDTCTWGACALGSAPGHDECGSWTDSISDALGTRSYSGDSCGAGDDSSTLACGGAGAPDVWYYLNLRSRRLVTIDTLGTSFDAVLRVAGPDYGCPGTEAACDDDSAGGTPGQALVSLVLEPGFYWVTLDGKTAGDVGDYVLNVNIADPGATPANDDCYGAVALPVSTGMRSVSGTTAGATHAASTGCSSALGPDVWYSLNLGEPTLVYLDTLDGRTWDSVLEVRSGSCRSATTVACAEDACGGLRSQWVGRLDAGTHYVRVDGRRVTDAGAFTLHVQTAAGSCATDAVVLSRDGTYTGDTSRSTNHSDPSCTAGRLQPDAVYALGGCDDLGFTATTCSLTTSFDTVLALYRDGCTGPSAGCNDDDPTCAPAGASTLTEPNLDARLYFLVVDGGLELPASGPYSLTVDLP